MEGFEIVKQKVTDFFIENVLNIGIEPSVIAQKVTEYFLSNVCTIGIGASIVGVITLLKKYHILYQLTHKVGY